MRPFYFPVAGAGHGWRGVETGLSARIAGLATHPRGKEEGRRPEDETRSEAYRLAAPSPTKIERTSSEIEVRTPQMSVTLLLRTTASSRPKRLAARFAARMLPKRKRRGPEGPPFAPEKPSRIPEDRVWLR